MNLTVKVQPNAFTVYGESAGPSGHIVGELLKFSKGDWVAGKDAVEIPDNTKLIAIMPSLEVGFQKWEFQKPVASRMGLLVEGFVPPPREELGDNDEELWKEVDEKGDPKDPWQLTNLLQLVNPIDRDKTYTFSTGSKGGLSAIAKLARQYGSAIQKEGRQDQLPVVQLSSDSYEHKNRSLGRIKTPDLKIVGWVREGDMSPVIDQIDDEIQF